MYSLHVDTAIERRIDRDLVRETSARKVQERWALTRLRIRQIELEKDLAAYHHTEQYDYTLQDETPTMPKVLSFIAVLQRDWRRCLDRIENSICRHLHYQPTYLAGDSYCQCDCGRMYGVPWGDVRKLPVNASLPAVFPPHERIEQFEGRGWTGRVDNQ